jgi:hypothetical protein
MTFRISRAVPGTPRSFHGLRHAQGDDLFLQSLVAHCPSGFPSSPRRLGGNRQRFSTVQRPRSFVRNATGVSACAVQEMWSARLATAVPPRALVPASLMHLSLMVLLRRTTVVFPLHATALGGAIWEFIAVLALVRGFDCPISRALRLRGRPPFRIRCLCMGAVVEVTRRQVDYQDERGTRGPSVARGDAASSRGSSGHAVSPSIAVTLLQNIARPFRGRESDLHNLSRAFWLYLTSDARARPRSPAPQREPIWLG